VKTHTGRKRPTRLFLPTFRFLWHKATRSIITSLLDEMLVHLGASPGFF